MKSILIKIIAISFILTIIFACNNVSKEVNSVSKEVNSVPEEVTLTKMELLNKVKGGWAGQTIGVTFGGPTEFRFKGTMIQDYIQIEWSDDLVSWFYDNEPGLYDDVYMDLTFVDVFEKYGMDASVDKFANAFANAEYQLWHANQAARYNILNGIPAPASGHWKNNMHADDIDFQIEADFAGLMSPGMINSSSEICDKIGHIMNYGDGFYAGVYVASLYSQAYVSDDVDFIVNEALKSIPSSSNYFKIMKEVIELHKKFPNDWKRAWFEIERSKWAEDLHCPDGVFAPFNIDATINSSYVLLGLLYGEGDFYKSMNIATRSGQDSDCNPATVAGILGTMLGYDKISDYWLNPLKKVEDRDFKYTTISLNDVYDMSFKHALEMISKNGGKIEGENVTIKYQKPIPLPLEIAFPDLYPIGNLKKGREPEFVMIDDKVKTIEFSGTGIVVKGSVNGNLPKNFVVELEVKLDGKIDRIMKLPYDNMTRANELYWNVDIPKGDHVLELKWQNPMEGGTLVSNGYVAFSNEPMEKTVHR